MPFDHTVHYLYSIIMIYIELNTIFNYNLNNISYLSIEILKIIFVITYNNYVCIYVVTYYILMILQIFKWILTISLFQVSFKIYQCCKWFPHSQCLNTRSKCVYIYYKHLYWFYSFAIYLCYYFTNASIDMLRSETYWLIFIYIYFKYHD